MQDWPRSLSYFVDINNYRKYSLALATQTPITTASAGGRIPLAAAVDPVSGDLLLQQQVGNGSPVLKLDPNTFATISSFGIVTSAPTYPTAVWGLQAIVCVVCNGVPYALMKYAVGIGTVAAIRVDTMQHAGFAQNVVSGSTNNRGIMCAGASGGSTASAFLTWQALQYSTSIPLYVVTITSGAETYNPATWPATNPHISWATVGTVAASAIDPTWSHLAATSIGYDLADGNVLLQAVTTDAVANRGYIVKLRATDAVVLWTVPVSTIVGPSLPSSRTNGSLWVFEGSGTTGTSFRIDTLTGQATAQPLNGVFYNTPGYPATDSENAIAVFYGNFTSRSGSPVAISSGLQFVGGLAVRFVREPRHIGRDRRECWTAVWIGPLRAPLWQPGDATHRRGRRVSHEACSGRGWRMPGSRVPPVMVRAAAHRATGLLDPRHASAKLRAHNDRNPATEPGAAVLRRQRPPTPGGTIRNAIGPTTPKRAWLDPDERRLTPTIVLDAAGASCGDGDSPDLRDAAGI